MMPQQHDRAGALAQRALRQRHQRERAALALVVGAQQDDTYLSVTTTISAHRISDSTPSTASRVGAAAGADAASTASRNA